MPTWLMNKYVLIGAGVVASLLAGRLLLASHDHGIRSAQEDLDTAKWKQALEDQRVQQAAHDEAYGHQLEAANAQLRKDLEVIPTRVITKPVWLRATGEICSGAVPATTEEAGGSPPGIGGVFGGRGIDIRPRIESLKVKYETALAECRLLDSSWRDK